MGLETSVSAAEATHQQQTADGPDEGERAKIWEIAKPYTQQQGEMGPTLLESDVRTYIQSYSQIKTSEKRAQELAELKQRLGKWAGKHGEFKKRLDAAGSISDQLKKEKYQEYVQMPGAWRKTFEEEVVDALEQREDTREEMRRHYYDVAYPLYKKGDFQGAIAASQRIQSLAKGQDALGRYRDEECFAAPLRWAEEDIADNQKNQAFKEGVERRWAAVLEKEGGGLEKKKLALEEAKTLHEELRGFNSRWEHKGKG